MNDPEKQPMQGPIYNIGVVTRLTGIPITSLHAWERRYGFPRSARTAGGHRLYTDKDVSMLRWVKSQVDAGLATHQAILAAQRLDQNKPGTPTIPVGPIQVQPSLSPLPALRERLSASILAHDQSHADQILGEMLAFYSPEELTLNVIGPLLNEIGEGWEAGKISVATEHLASNYLRQRLLMWMVSGPRPQQAKPIVLACAPGEWHDGSLLMLGVLLRRQGWPVAYMGQNVPFADLADFLRQIQPKLVVLVAMREDPARALIEWPNWIGPDNRHVHLTFGGRAFVFQPELISQVPGIYLGDTLQEGFGKLLSMIGNS